MHSKSLTWLFVLTCSMFMATPLVNATWNDNTDFQETHQGADFPVGWTQFNLNGAFSPQVRMMYPAMEDGEDAEMAGNGPFPWAFFIGDSGEALDGYSLLLEPIVQRGYIVVVSQPMQDETNVQNTLNTLDAVVGHMHQQNVSNAYVMGSVNNIDVEHYALLGHGKGATAVYLAYPFWDLTSQSQNHQPPRGLVCFAMDMSDLNLGFEWTDVDDNPQFATPNAGLFMTGTVDEVSPSFETMERVESLGGYGWQWMHVLGADHYQFQDTRSIFENDGDPTMSQSAQIEFAVQHTVAYFDTVIKGDHSRFRFAFNRGLAADTVSNNSAYIDEALEASSFLRIQDIQSNAESSEIFNASMSFILQANWTLRSGEGYLSLPSTWEVNVSCGWKQGTWPTLGILDANGTATCEYPMAQVAPGQHDAWMRIAVEGAPSTIWATATRGNTPLEVIYPQPIIHVPQHGQASLLVGEVAVDPDGQSVLVMNSSLNCVDASHFGVDVSPNQSMLTLYHAVVEEWIGECMLDVHLRSAGGVVDETNTSLRVMLMPVDDPVFQTATVPIQEMDEDGEAVVFDLSSVVTDPEGETLLFRVDGQAIGQKGPVQFEIDEQYMTMTPLPNLFGATVIQVSVSDGYNPPLTLDVPIVVTSVNDPVVVNLSAWQGDLIMDEDTTYTLELSPIAYDVDGDALTWTIQGVDPRITVVKTASSITFTPGRDLNGIFPGVWLNVSDGNSSQTFSFNIDITPVGDLPYLLIENIQRLDGESLATMQWSVEDVDGETSTNAIVLIDTVAIVTNHSCLQRYPGAFECITLLPLPEEINSTLFIQVKLTDTELQRSVIAEYVFDPTSVSTNQSQETTTDNNGMSSQNVAIIVIVVSLGFVLIFGFIKQADSQARLQRDEKMIEEDVNVPQGKSSSGLLERAKRLK